MAPSHCRCLLRATCVPTPQAVLDADRIWSRDPRRARHRSYRRPQLPGHRRGEFQHTRQCLRLWGLIAKSIGDAAADRHVESLECEMSVEQQQAFQDLSVQPSNLRPIRFGYVCLHSHSLVRQ